MITYYTVRGIEKAQMEEIKQANPYPAGVLRFKVIFEFDHVSSVWKKW